MSWLKFILLMVIGALAALLGLAIAPIILTCCILWCGDWMLGKIQLRQNRLAWKAPGWDHHDPRTTFDS
jgi:hypothetical protein